jgi:hypothetical protein
MFPNPLGPITDDTQPYGLLGDHAGVFLLLSDLAQFLFGLHLVPTEHMHDALAVA